MFVLLIRGNQMRAVTTADAARRIAERSGLLVLKHGSASRISLVEGDDGRFALVIDAPRHSECGSIHLRQVDGSPFEPGHVLVFQEAENAARKLLGIDGRKAVSVPKRPRRQRGTPVPLGAAAAMAGAPIE